MFHTVVTIQRILFKCADLTELETFCRKIFIVIVSRNINQERNVDLLKETGVFYKMWSVL